MAQEVKMKTARPTKLTPTQIKNVQASTKTSAELAKHYGVCKATIYNYKARGKKKKEKKGESPDEKRLHALLSPDALDMIHREANGVQENIVSSMASVLNWAAAARQADVASKVRKDSKLRARKKKLTFAQKLKKVLKLDVPY